MQFGVREHMIWDLFEYVSCPNSLAHSRNAFTFVLFIPELLAVDI